MEARSEHERYEQGCLNRECAASIAVASLQQLLALFKEEDNGTTES